MALPRTARQALLCGVNAEYYVERDEFPPPLMLLGRYAAEASTSHTVLQLGGLFVVEAEGVTTTTMVDQQGDVLLKHDDQMPLACRLDVKVVCGAGVPAYRRRIMADIIRLRSVDDFPALQQGVMVI